MKCEDALLLISGHIDGVNTPKEEQLLQEHLKICGQCREVLLAFLEQDLGIAAMAEEPPTGFCEKVMEAVAAEQAPRKKRRWWPAVAAAAAALAIGFGAGYLPMFEEQPEAVPMIARTMPVEYAASNFLQEINGQILSEVRRANVVETTELLPELESCPYETMEDGSLLYLLPAVTSAAELGETYGLEVYFHQGAEESYALLLTP